MTYTPSLWSYVWSVYALRYAQGHIWACPPSEGDDYIFHCHPPDQKIPKPKRLQEWYRKMLDKAFAERILHDYKVRRRKFLLNTGTRLTNEYVKFVTVLHLHADFFINL